MRIAFLGNFENDNFENDMENFLIVKLLSEEFENFSLSLISDKQTDAEYLKKITMTISSVIIDTYNLSSFEENEFDLLVIGYGIFSQELCTSAIDRDIPIRFYGLDKKNPGKLQGKIYSQIIQSSEFAIATNKDVYDSYDIKNNVFILGAHLSMLYYDIDKTYDGSIIICPYNYGDEIDNNNQIKLIETIRLLFPEENIRIFYYSDMDRLLQYKLNDLNDMMSYSIHDKARILANAKLIISLGRIHPLIMASKFNIPVIPISSLNTFEDMKSFCSDYGIEEILPYEASKQKLIDSISNPKKFSQTEITRRLNNICSQFKIVESQFKKMPPSISIANIRDDKIINIVLLSGIGDVIFAWYKIIHFVRMGYKFNVFFKNAEPKRAHQLLGLLDGLVSVNYIDIETQPYDLVNVNDVRYPDKMALYKNAVVLHVNSFLEHFYNIETFMPKYPCDYSIDLCTTEKSKAWAKSVCKKDKFNMFVYTSSVYNNTHCNVIPDPEKWVILIKKIYDWSKTKKPLRIIIVGANYDIDLTSKVHDLLWKNCIESNIFIDKELGDIYEVIKESDYGLVYESGFNMMCDLARIPYTLVLRDQYGREDKRIITSGFLSPNNKDRFKFIHPLTESWNDMLKKFS